MSTTIVITLEVALLGFIISLGMALGIKIMLGVIRLFGKQQQEKH